MVTEIARNNLEKDFISETVLLNIIKTARKEYKDKKTIKSKSLASLVGGLKNK